MSLFPRSTNKCSEGVNNKPVMIIIIRMLAYFRQVSGSCSVSASRYRGLGTPSCVSVSPSCPQQQPAFPSIIFHSVSRSLKWRRWAAPSPHRPSLTETPWSGSRAGSRAWRSWVPGWTPPARRGSPEVRRMRRYVLWRRGSGSKQGTRAPRGGNWM